MPKQNPNKNTIFQSFICLTFCSQKCVTPKLLALLVWFGLFGLVGLVWFGLVG